MTAFNRWRFADWALPLTCLLLSLPLCVQAQNTNFSSIMQSSMAGQQNFNNSANRFNSINNDLRQNINGGAAQSAPSTCDIPYDLLRGPAGFVPPALQGDPRYQEYLRCRYGDVPITPAMASVNVMAPVRPASGYMPGQQQAPKQAPQQASMQAPQHLPSDATDFIPASPGHPLVDQQIAAMQLPNDQRAALVQWVNNSFSQVAQNYRPNNLAVSVCLVYAESVYVLNGTRIDTPHIQNCITGMNDAMGSSRKFVLMSPAEKQNNYESWVFEESILQMLKTSAEQGNVQLGQQAIQLAQRVMQVLSTL